uniref:Uncharacterized protein n=1 Tax=viral metagenome TaxID=1070528 RepID=A0A6C0J683_9ZZZZ
MKYINLFNCKIITAQYGIKNNYLNVLDLILENSNNIITINNIFFKKDPIYGKKKHLLLTFDNNNESIFHEDTKITFYNQPISDIKTIKTIKKLSLTENNYILSTNIKDEDNILEWIIYHLLIGFDKILIIDNNSKVSIKKIIKTYNFQNKIDIIEINKKYKVKMNILNHIVLPYMNKNCKKYFIHIDGNEYINLNSKYNNIDDLLKNYKYPNNLILHCLNFGSNFLKKNNDKYKRLLPNYIKCDNKLDNKFKCFYKINSLSEETKFINGEIINTKNKLININNLRFKNDSNIFYLCFPKYNKIENVECFINNYIIQSEEDYIKRKINRGNDYNGLANLFNKNILKSYNIKEYTNLHNIYSEKIKDIIENNKIKIGFIILRYVNNKETSKYWINCYKSIRKFYNNPILILDDNSDNQYVINIELENCTIINSNFSRRGELLPYYYFLENPFCDRAIILHDTMNIEKKIDFENITNYMNYTRIFSFCNNSYKIDISNFQFFTTYLKNGENIYKFHKKNINNLIGCFGVCFIIDYNFLLEIEKKYNIKNLVNCIFNRNNRKTLERLLSCIFEYESNLTKKSTIKSLLGDIQSNIYLQNKNENVFIKKVFCGR